MEHSRGGKPPGMKDWRCTNLLLCEKPQFPINFSFVPINPINPINPWSLSCPAPAPGKRGHLHSEILLFWNLIILESLYPGIFLSWNLIILESILESLYPGEDARDGQISSNIIKILPVFLTNLGQPGSWEWDVKSSPKRSNWGI